MSSVQVAVRTRPFSRREVDLDSPFCIEAGDKSVVIYKSGLGVGRSPGLARSNAKEFVFDHAYWSVDPRDDHYTDQEQVFSDLGVPVLNSAFEGYNACIFAYGQTGSGKTYTMMGTDMATGLIPRICEGLYSRMAGTCEDEVSYRTEVSYMEIYNEKVRDLLNHGASKSQTHSLRVREHPIEGPYVEDLSKHTVSDYAGISRLIDIGNTHRVTASTKMNDTSSRSHAIFTIRFTQAKYMSDLPSETVSKIHLVDLAGSERASQTGAEGDRLKEGGSINKSLVCLGTVISSLADLSARSGRQKKPYIPYRDSVLTWLLRDSLGGNSKTIMIATISPAESSYGETLSTLRYASRAKNIVNKPTVNEDPHVKEIRDLRAEIQRLKSVIATGSMESSAQPARLPPTRSMSLAEDIHRKEEQVAELTREWAEKWKNMQKIIKERHVALHSEGVKMVVDSEHPHFVAVDPDILSTGLVFYYLKDGGTTIGSRGSPTQPDIAMSGGDIQAEHCRVEYHGGRVYLHPLHGDTFVNHSRISRQTRLRQGDLLQLGTSTVFRFNHPHEALKLRKRHSEGLLTTRRSAKTRPPKISGTRSRSMSPELPQHSLMVQSSGVLSSSCTGTTGTSLVLLKKKQSERLLDWGSADLPALPKGDSRETQHFTPKKPPLWRRVLYYGLLWMCAPVLLLVVGSLTFPAFSMLAVLLCSMKVFGISRHFWPLRWPATFVAMATTLIVSPVAGLYEVFFRLAYRLLTSLRQLEPPRKHVT